MGPRLSFQSAWSTNAVSICRSCGLDAIPRLEVSRRFLLRSSKELPADTVAKFAAMVRTEPDNEPCRPRFPQIIRYGLLWLITSPNTDVCISVIAMSLVPVLALT